MNVLITGAYGRCGTALLDHLTGYDLTIFNRSDRPADHPYGGYDTIVGDVADAAAIEDAAAGVDAIVHLAAYPYTEGDWSDVLEPNIVGMYNVLEAARVNECESVVFGSTNHVMGMYERDHEPDLYEPGYDLLLDHTDPVRPDSFYGATKSFGEDLGRCYVEEYEYPERFYAIRICSVRDAAYDHPYGDAEAQVEEGEIERGSPKYDRAVARMKATWHSRRDFAHEVECCLQDESVTYDVFSGVSDNDRRWFDIEHARQRIGYDPQDNGEEWDAPPTDTP
jgi:nucleoside-diphosphate-sugar epimerase